MGSEKHKKKEHRHTMQFIVHLQRRPLWLLFVANIISFTGSVLTLLAIPWYVLQSTGSATQMGIVAFVATVPLVISAFLGSLLVDRLGFKRTSIISDVMSGSCIACIPLLSETIGLAFWQLLVLVFLSGLLKTPGQTARGSMLPDLADGAKMRRERANAIMGGINQTSLFIGAPLATLLIAVIGTQQLLWLDALSYVLSALLIGLFVPPMQTTSSVRAHTTLRHLHGGLRFMFSDSMLLALIGTITIANLLNEGLIAVVAPTTIKQVFHSPLPFGMMYGAFSGAALVGTLIFGAIGHRLPRRLTLGIGFTLGGVARFWILFVPLLPLLIGVHILAGLGAAPLNPLIDTLVQERTPAHMRARVFGITAAGAWIGLPLGSLLSGFLVTWIGTHNTLLLMGACYLLTALSLFVNPVLQQMKTQAPL
jgi:MFS family permease